MINPKEHDTKIAAKCHKLAKAEQQLEYKLQTAYAMCNFRAGYKGRKFTYFIDEEGSAPRVARLEDALESLRGYDSNERSLRHGKTFDEARKNVEDAVDGRELIRHEIHDLEADYTGWSRFFLVTSSPGHIHSSMRCHTCRPTTTFGWLPDLSGLTEEDAVKVHGPALCSECFKSAPSEWTGQKISKGDARKAVA